MVSVSTCQSREDGVEYLPAIQKLFGSFKGDAFKLRVLPFFMRAMPDIASQTSFDLVENHVCLDLNYMIVACLKFAALTYGLIISSLSKKRY